MLYITSPWLIYFITGSLYLLAAFTHFAHTPPTTSGNHQSLLCIYELLLLLLLLLLLPSPFSPPSSSSPSSSSSFPPSSSSSPPPPPPLYVVALSFSEQNHTSSLCTLFPVLHTGIYYFQLRLLSSNSRTVHCQMPLGSAFVAYPLLTPGHTTVLYPLRVAAQTSFHYLSFQLLLASYKRYAFLLPYSPCEFQEEKEDKWL